MNAQEIAECEKMSEKLYGVVLENKQSGKTIELWFDDPEQMDKQISIFSRDMYRIKEYLHEQQELIFDIGIG